MTCEYALVIRLGLHLVKIRENRLENQTGRTALNRGKEELDRTYGKIITILFVIIKVNLVNSVDY